MVCKFLCEKLEPSDPLAMFSKASPTEAATKNHKVFWEEKKPHEHNKYVKSKINVLNKNKFQ